MGSPNSVDVSIGLARSKRNRTLTRQRQEYLTEAKDWLGRLELTIAADRALRHQDSHIELETFFRDLLNLVFDWNLENSNTRFGTNQNSFDLSDKAGSLAVQVTVTTNAEKIRNTLKGFIGTYDVIYKRLIFVYPKVTFPSSRADFSDDLKGFDFNAERDRLGFGSILKQSQDFTIDKLDRLIQLLRKELRPMGRPLGVETSAVPDELATSQQKLEQLLAESHGRRVARWQSAGVTRLVAIELSRDELVGKLPEQSLPNENSPLKLVVAPLGAGKSLAAERYFEACVRTNLRSAVAPIPVYVEALNVHDGLERAIHSACNGLGDPTAIGACFVVDGLDDLSTRSAQRLLSEARAIVNSWPSSRAILTSRSMRCWGGLEECVTIAPLDESSALRLVATSSSRSESEIQRIHWHWSSNLKEAIRTPLFAILFGKNLKDGRESSRISRAGLIAHLVESAIETRLLNSDGIKRACRKLATECLDRDGAIPASELEPRQIIEELLPTGLVAEVNGLLRFPLPVITQWFAAQAIVEGEVNAESFWRYPGRIDRWRSAIAIVAGTGSEKTVERVLTPIAKHDPGFLMTLIDEATSHWNLDIGAPPPNAMDAARRLRNAMIACKAGIGIVGEIITPINPQTGHLLTTAARTDGEWLIAGWSTNGGDAEVDSLPPQIRPPGPSKVGENVLPGHEEMLQFTYGFVRPYWFSVRGARPGRQSAWAWRWVVEHLQTMLKERLQPASIFDFCAAPLVTESAWHAANSLLSRSGDRAEPISLKTIECNLPLSIQKLKSLSQAFQPTIVKIGWKKVDLTMLGVECQRLDKLGATELLPPLPLPDQTQRVLPHTSFVWERFSTSRTFERISAVFQLSLRAYTEIVEEWFAPIAMRLDRFAILPARILVEIDMKAGPNPMLSDPKLRITWEPLPNGSLTEVVLQAGDFNFCAFDSDACTRLHERAIQMRPERAESIGVVICNSGSHDMFADFSIRKLVYSWLEDDLRKIHWI